MADQRDRAVVEAAQIQQGRLAAALMYGRLDERRTVTDYTKRLLVSVVVTAIVSAGCAATSFVSSLIAQGFTMTGSTSAASPSTVGGKR
jgi:hypothetical protein